MNDELACVQNNQDTNHYKILSEIIMEHINGFEFEKVIDEQAGDEQINSKQLEDDKAENRPLFIPDLAAEFEVKYRKDEYPEIILIGDAHKRDIKQNETDDPEFPASVAVIPGLNLFNGRQIEPHAGLLAVKIGDLPVRHQPVAQ